jgi:hypothetical protein
MESFAAPWVEAWGAAGAELIAVPLPQMAGDLIRGAMKMPFVVVEAPFATVQDQRYGHATFQVCRVSVVIAVAGITEVIGVAAAVGIGGVAGLRILGLRIAGRSIAVIRRRLRSVASAQWQEQGR